MTKQDSESTVIEPLLSVAQVASLLGVNRFTIYHFIQTARLRSVHVGRRRMVRPEDLRRYIQDNLTGER